MFLYKTDIVTLYIPMAISSELSLNFQLTNECITSKHLLVNDN